MVDFYLIDIGWLFFGAWGVVVAVVAYKAFGPDLLHSRNKQKLSTNMNASPIKPSSVR